GSTGDGAGGQTAEVQRLGGSRRDGAAATAVDRAKSGRGWGRGRHTGGLESDAIGENVDAGIGTRKGVIGRHGSLGVATRKVNCAGVTRSRVAESVLGRDRKGIGSTGDGAGGQTAEVQRLGGSRRDGGAATAVDRA